ncbi:phage portal protein [Anaerosporobacter sp.]
MNIEEYKMTFDNPSKWFVEEVNKGYHKHRIANVIANRDYLSGQHKILLKEDATYKGKELITRKTIINYAKTVLNFHNTYLLGKPVSLTGDAEIKKNFNDIYKLGLYNTIDYQILDRVNKFSDAYEVVYMDGNKIKSKVLDSADGYPVYDDMGNYIAFIEHWTDIYSSISYYNVYYPNYVECWSNDGGNETLIESKINVCGLPIHYHNFNDSDYHFGESLLVDIKPLLDELEDILSKMGDAIYVNSLNPMPVAIGQRIENTIPADATGYVLNLDNGDYKVVSTMMDYNTIKLYLDNIKEMINQVGCIPSVLGTGNIANVSEVSLKMLFHMANIKAQETEKWLNIGMQERFKKFKQILSMQGIKVEGDIDIEYNLSIPVATDEVVANLKAMQEMGAISVETIMEKSELIKDVSVEKTRLEGEKGTVL